MQEINKDKSSRLKANSTSSKWNQDGKKEEVEKRLGRAPKSRVCYICGRMYMLHSFKIHEQQCRALFVAREALKAPKDRKACPADPAMAAGYGHGQGQGQGQGHTGGGFGFSVDRLDELNAASQAAYSSATLSQCCNCLRTMLPEKLPMHNRLCTKENPARRVGESIRVDRNRPRPRPRPTENDRPAASAGTAPKTTASRNAANSKRPTQAAQISPKDVARKAGSAAGSGAGAGAGAAPSWRSQSNAFRAAIKNARRISRAEQLAAEFGEPVESFLVPPSAEEQWLLNQASGGAGLIECQGCGRSFNAKAAERHFPLCESIVNKPTRLIRGSGHGHGGAATLRASSAAAAVASVASAAAYANMPTRAPAHISAPSAVRSTVTAPGPSPAATHARRSSGGSLAATAAAFQVVPQGRARETRDHGVSVYEHARVGWEQRVHPSPPVPARSGVFGPEPYGLGRRVVQGSTAAAARDASAAARARTQPSSPAKVAGGAAGTGTGTMATAHGSLLQKLMSAKQQVAAAGGAGMEARSRTSASLNASLQRKKAGLGF